MSLFAAIESALPQLVAEAEALMQDTFTIHIPASSTTDADGYEVSGYSSGGTVRGKVGGLTGDGIQRGVTETVNISGVDREVRRAGISVSIDSPAPTVGRYGIGWEYEVTAVGPRTDPALLGSRWLALSSPVKSYATSRRLDVVQLG